MQLRNKKIEKILKSFLTTQRGKNFFLYLVFVVISFVFWLLLTLNNQVQQEYRIPINVTDVPDSITMISNFPPNMKVVVKEKGTTLLRYSLGSTPTLNVSFNEYNDGENRFRISSGQLRNLISNMFGNNVTIVSVSPDSINTHYTTLPPKKVPIVFDIKASANFQYVISGKIKASTYYAYVYGDRETLSRINKVYTYPFEEKELKDTIKRTLKLRPISNAKVTPETIIVTIPVQPLITKKVTVPVISRGVPYGVNIVTFPSKVSISYLVPANEYKDSQNFLAEVYYQDVIEHSNKLKLYINNTSWNYGEVTLDTDSVEYIIEKSQN